MFSKLIRKPFLRNIFVATFLLGTILVTPACWQRYNPTQWLRLTSNIHEVKNLHLLEQEIPKLDEHSLVIFDIDDTLVIAENGFGSRHNKKGFAIWYPLYEKLRKAISRDKLKVLLSRMDVESQLIDKNVIHLIDLIKKQNAKVCALTLAFTGKCGDEEHNEEHRFQTLQKLGIDFRSSFPEYESFTLSELVTEDSVPMFHKGILLTAYSTKGQTLTVFLNTINWWPNKIIFIDDRIEKLEDVARIAKEKNIEFLGLHYLATEDLPCDVDPKVAEFQMNYLLEHEQWVGEEKAKELMKEEK